MFPEINGALSQQVDTAIAEYLNAVKRGVPPDRDEFISQHKEIAAELEQFLADHHALDGAAQAIAKRASTDHAANSTGRAAMLVRPSLTSPQRFGNFELMEEIARGGMGVVYKARQSTPSRIVALKMILAGRFATQADIDRFEVEAHAAAALDHPQIVPIFEVGECEGQHFFTMAFVDGQSLSQRLADGPLPAKEAAKIIFDVCLAVAYAHEHGVVHRDLKPANLLVEHDGRVRVSDFGLAKRQADDSGLTRTGELLGTPSFMAPEQVSGDPSRIGPVADVYSLGATLYALLTGRPPFQAASTVDTLKQVVDQDPVPPRDLDATIPLDLQTIALKCLEKAPERRYTSARELADDLDRFLEGRPIAARPVGRGELVWRWCRRNPLPASLAAGVVAALSIGIACSTYFAASSAREAKIANANLVWTRKTLSNVNEILNFVHKRIESWPEAEALRKPLRDDILQRLEPLAREIEQRDVDVDEETIHLLDNVALLQWKSDRAAESLQTSLHTIDLAERLAKADPAHEPLLAEMQVNLGYYLLNAATSKQPDIDLAPAKSAALKAIADREKKSASTQLPPKVALFYRDLALCAARNGDYAEAQRLRLVGIDRGEAVLNKTPNLRHDQRTQCRLLYEYGKAILEHEKSPTKIAETGPYFERAISHAKCWGEIDSLEPSESLDARIAAAEAEFKLGSCRLRVGRSDEGTRLMRQAINELRSSPYPEPIRRAQWTQSELVADLGDSGRTDEAKAAAIEFKNWVAGVAAGVPDNGISREEVMKWQGLASQLLGSVDAKAEVGL